MLPGWRHWPGRSISIVFTVAAGLLVVSLAASPYLESFRESDEPWAQVRSVSVRRVDWLTASITASGRAASANNTEIRCELERLTSPGAGGSISSNGSSMILSLIPDGTTVKQGDVLCELDSAEYTELVRRQQIGVSKAEADHRQAELNLAIAEINLRSYLEGTVRQAGQQFEGQVALTTSDLARQEDRLEWAKRMLEKGYASLSQVTGEQETLMRLQFSLSQIRMSFDNYQRYNVPRDTRTLTSQVDSAKASLLHQQTRLKLEQDRLALFKLQVERCTIRAPHDGFLIYANEPGEPERVWEGAPVRKRQRLFYLPDLTKMEVQAMVHETVVDRVSEGMPAQIRFEAIPGRLAEGHVVSIARLPLIDQNSGGTGVKYYLARVALDKIPSGLRPGMSAELEIITSRLPEVLVLPPVAISVEKGRDVCYVIGDDGIERREVKVGQRNPKLMQVVEGLDEGERIVLEPASQLEGIPL